MACIIYHANLDYDVLPTANARKRARTETGSNAQKENHVPYQSPARKLTNQQPQIQSANYYNSHNEFHQTAKEDTSPVSTAKKIQFETSPYFKSSSHPTTGQTQASNGRYTPLSMSCPNNRSFRSHPPAPPSEPPTKDVLTRTLQKYFNFSTFRENQLPAIMATCQGLDTLILMPTGGGKSICYQLPAILSVGLTIVVSPLKSLIEDQVSRLRSRGVRTTALYGDTSDVELSDLYFDLNSPEPEHKLLYVTPEKINCSNSFISLLKQLHSRNLLARFVIDEAHCVSMWGSDFRPDYRKLGKLRELFSNVPIMALTATAPPKVRDDIFDQLQIDKNRRRLFIQSFNRPNLKFEVKTKSKGCLVDINNLIRKQFRDQCGIVYCLSRNDCSVVSQKLRDHGITSAPYHAGLSDCQRKKVFSAWSKGTFQVVCATIAFGMGIDKSDVRFVIHYSVPKSLEGYYQEAGRAGRDGQFASCILYYSKSDMYRMKSMLKRGIGRTDKDRTRDEKNLESITDYVENRKECRRSILMRYLGEEFDSRNCISQPKTACDNCLQKGGY